MTDVQIEPFAGPTLPPAVASGELITSAWGNQVASSLSYVQGVIDTAWVTYSPNVSMGANLIGSVGTYLYEPGNVVNVQIQWAFNAAVPAGAMNMLLPAVPADTDFAGYATNHIIGSGNATFASGVGIVQTFSVIALKTGGAKAWAYSTGGGQVTNTYPTTAANGDSGAFNIRYKYV